MKEVTEGVKKYLRQLQWAAGERDPYLHDLEMNKLDEIWDGLLPIERMDLEEILSDDELLREFEEKDNG